MDQHHQHQQGGGGAAADHGGGHQVAKKQGKQHNVLPLWGNESSMNLNPLILTNIQSSSYFKVSLFKLKTYHEVVDEIYYQVKHLEPWERGSRKTAGQTGMCGGVRGVGAGGIVSTAYCLLYKLYTLRLTRKQLNGLLTHTDSPYIRALGFMYIRYTQPPADLYDWFEEYLLDEEEVDAKAGGGPPTLTIGQMLHQLLVKLDWFSTLFPRIPVPIQKQIEQRLHEFSQQNGVNLQARYAHAEREQTAANHAAASAAAAAAAAHNAVGGGGGGSRYQNQHQKQQSQQSSASGMNRYYDRQDRDDRGSRDNRRFRSRSRERDDRYGGDSSRDAGSRGSAYGSSSSASNRQRGGSDRGDADRDYRDADRDYRDGDRRSDRSDRDRRYR